MATKTKKPMCPKHCCYYHNCGCTEPKNRLTNTSIHNNNLYKAQEPKAGYILNQITYELPHRRKTTKMVNSWTI